MKNANKLSVHTPYSPVSMCGRDEVVRGGGACFMALSSFLGA